MESAVIALQAINFTLGEIKRSLNELTAAVKEYGDSNKPPNKPDYRKIADEVTKRICEDIGQSFRDIDAGLQG